MATFQVTTVRKLKIKVKRTRSSIGRKKKRKERKEKKRKEKEGLFLNLNPNPIKNPRRAKENLKLISSPHLYQKASWRNQRRSSEAKEAQLQNLLQAFQAATSDNKGLSYSCFLSYLFLYWLVGYPVKPLRFLVSL